MSITRCGAEMSLCDLRLEGTKETLTVGLSAKTGEMFFGGVSICNNARDYYQRCLDWLSEYAHSPAASTHVSFSLKYYNTSTSKVLLEMLQIFESILHAGGEVSVVWNFRAEDVDMEDAGLEFAENTILPFQLQEVK